MTSQVNATANTEDFEFAALHEARNYRAALLNDFSPFLRGNVLEVGAGVGQFTSALLGLGAIQRLVSIEPDPGFCLKVREQIPSAELVEGTVADLNVAADWNAILSINVLEHIEDDRDELNAYARLLGPAQGTLCLFVPARPEIYAPIDKDFGHFRRYTRKDLGRKLELAGFRTVSLRYFNFVGYFLWWVNFCLLRQRSFSVSSVRLFDRAIFPSIHGLEKHVLTAPIGQSLMAIATALPR